MRCITWNVHGLRDPRRRGVMGRYLKEWGADIICLQETMLANTEQRTWSDLGWGGNETHVSIEASGHSGGILLAWKTSLFDREEIWKGKHVVATRLIHRADGRNLVVASAYGPTNASNRGELWEDLNQLCTTFPNTALLIGGDFNVTLTSEDRPNDMGGQDPGSATFGRLLLTLVWEKWGQPTSGSHGMVLHRNPGSTDSSTLQSSVTSTPWPR